MAARGLPEPTTAVAIDSRRQGQRIDRDAWASPPASLLYSWDTGQAYPHPPS